MKFFPGEIEELKRRLRALSRAPLQSPDADRPLDPSPKARERRERKKGDVDRGTCEGRASEPSVRAQRPSAHFQEGVAKHKDGRFQARFRYKAPGSKTLSSCRRYLDASTWSEAYRECERLRAELTGQASQEGRLSRTVSEAVDVFLVEYPKRRLLRGSTCANMKHVLTKHLVPALEERTMSSLTDEDMHALVERWCAKTKGASDELYSKSTIGNWVNVTRSFLGAELGSAGVGRLLKAPTGAKRHRGRALEGWEIMLLLETLKGDELDGKHAHYYALILMALLTGQRAGSLLALRWSDLCFERRTISFALSHYRGEVNEGNKSGRVTKIHIPEPSDGPDLFEALREHLFIIKDKRYKRRPDESADALVFPPRQRAGQTVAQHMQPSTVTHLLKRLSAQLGLEKITIHDLRRTFVTSALNADVPIDKVQAIVGHANVWTTRGYYAPNAEDHGKLLKTVQHAMFTTPRRPLSAEEERSIFEDAED
jgi:integrase